MARLAQFHLYVYGNNPLQVLRPACADAHAGMPSLGPAPEFEYALLQWLKTCYARKRNTTFCEACGPFFILSLQRQVTLDRVIVLCKSTKQVAFVLRFLFVLAAFIVLCLP